MIKTHDAPPLDDWSELDEIIEVRGSNYGPYDEMAAVAQAIKNALRTSREWKNLPPEMAESLDLMSTKMARIACGNPHHRDSWRDIEGYAVLPFRD